LPSNWHPLVLFAATTATTVAIVYGSFVGYVAIYGTSPGTAAPSASLGTSVHPVEPRSR
jgi:hypothetical protein